MGKGERKEMDAVKRGVWTGESESMDWVKRVAMIRFFIKREAWIGWVKGGDGNG